MNTIDQANEMQRGIAIICIALQSWKCTNFA
jgi:hypothetical protein